MNITIGITTFKYRYEKYFKPLIHSIKQYNPEIEIIVAINGEHKEKFDETYRRDILREVSDYTNTYPIIFPQFRGLSKLWNSIVINSNNDYILMLNDDISIVNPNYLFDILQIINHLQTSFKINGSWSHVVLKKSEIIDIGFIDERLLGIGEEDGFFEWKYFNKYQKGFCSVGVNGIINYIDMTHNPTNTKVIRQGKYSLLNQKVMYETIFTVDDKQGQQHGICPAKLIPNDNIVQYPYEKFYLENRENL